MANIIENKLNEIIDNIKGGRVDMKGQRTFGGADTIITTPERYAAGYTGWETDEVVVTKYAREVSYLIFQLQDMMKEIIDYMSKYEFYPALGKAGKKYLEVHGDDIGILDAIAQAALAYAKNTSTLYFAYGSNMNEDQMNDRCPESVQAGLAVLRNYRFELDGKCRGTIVPDEGNYVQGLLWKCSWLDIKELDEHEGVKWNTYYREFVDVECTVDGTQCKKRAIVYISNRAPYNGSNFDQNYMDKINTAAEKLGIDEHTRAQHCESWARFERAKYKLYFAYGSNLVAEQMADRCPGAKQIGVGTLEGYRLCVVDSGYATIEPCEGSHVQGLIWACTKSDIANLDYYEGVDSGFYHQEMLPVICEHGGCVQECMVYIAEPSKERTVSMDWYMGSILMSAHKLALDNETFAQLLGMAGLHA